MTVLIAVLWKTGAVLGAALCINLLLRARSADVRRMILETAIVGMFVAALLSPMLPRLATATSVVTQVEFLRATPAATATTTATAAIPLPVVPLIWCVFASLLLARVAIGLRGLHKLRLASQPAVHPTIAQFAGTGLRSPHILQNSSIAAPVTWGILKPIILVPADFEQLPVESLQAVLSHELAHIRSYDFLFRVLTEIACALIWFQPLIWLVRRQLREEQELACDNGVLAAGGKPSAYARLLLDWDLRPGAAALPAVGIAHRSCLKRRLYALLDTTQRRNRVPPAGVLAAVLLCLAMTLPIAALDLTTPAKLPILLAQVIPAPAPAPQAAPASIRAVQVSPPQFRSATTIVIVAVTVTDQSGAPIDGLTADDFTLTENGRSQTIASFELEKSNQDGTTHYLLGHYTSSPASDGSFRRIAVSLKRNTSASLYYRVGYYPSQTANTAAAETNISAPVIMRKVDPEYSEEARRAKYSGSAILSVEVDITGTVASAKVIRSLGMGLDEKAVEAVNQWKFRPALNAGKPVPAEVQVEVSFALL